MPPLHYPTKPFFFMIARYPGATPPEWILPQNLQPPKSKIGANDDRVSCKMRYAQTIRAAAPMVEARGYTPLPRCMGMTY